MNKLYAHSLFAVILVLTAFDSYAESKLSVRLRNSAKQLSISLKAPDNLNCSGTLLLSTVSRPATSILKSKSQNLPIISSVSTTKLTVPELRKVHARNSQKVYFRATFTCNNGHRYVRTESLIVPATSSSKGFISIRRWIDKVRSGIAAEITKIIITPTPIPNATATVVPTFAAFPPSSLRLARTFSNISFSSPIDLQDPKDGTNRLFIAEQGGSIYSFENSGSVSSKNLFLDIASKIKSGGEQGLLGLAFHPNFQSNGYFFVNYTRAGDGATVVARYSANGNHADVNSELIFITVAQPFDNHNGGSLQFGPDGNLYIAIGDGGSGGDPQNNGQNLAAYLGKILRIDVNSPSSGNNFSIPPTNPFINTQGARPEIFALGFRNPWRISFDSSNGRFWVADVGQGDREEVDVVESGGNYGWKIMEGFECYPPNTSCDKSGLKLPVADYSHSLGQSITGGYVYHGTAVPALAGVYLYADFISGRLWGIRRLSPLENSVLIDDTGLSISTFGIDRNGEVYVVDYGGRIFQFQD